MTGQEGARPEAVQHVTATGGFAYGVVGADIHVLGDGAPLYLLKRWTPPGPPSASWLREVPSRLLHARSAVVAFTGRGDELDRLRAWRDGEGDVAAHWLHGPGGAGKTRLADRLAAESEADGWLVVTATHGPGAVSVAPGGQDLRADGRTGVLLVVDYADQWPQSHLRWLLSNALFARPGVPARLLLVARTDGAWPAVRGALVALRARTSSSALASLPTADRGAMFAAARDAFAPYYDLTDPAEVRQAPDVADDPEFGLTLAVHMAALVAVDAHAANRTPPSDLAGTTAYLLDREHLHWHRMHERRGGYRTAPEVMRRMVFAATLTGARPHAAAHVVAERLGVPDHAVDDHVACYPPEDGAALEPLYPDRLAEDFLALTLPGHQADHPAAPWAAATVRAVLARVPTSREPAEWTPRAVTFLAAAAQRWPHVADTVLFPLLRLDPHLAVAAGSGALGVIATIPDVDQAVLAGISGRFPAMIDPDLATGVAAVRTVQVGHQLAEETDPATRAALHGALSSRLISAGRYDRALEPLTECVALRRDLAATDPDAHAAGLAAAVDNLAIVVSALGRRAEALRFGEESVALHRGLVAAEPERFATDLSRSLGNLSSYYAKLGRARDAEEAAEEAVAIQRGAGDPDDLAARLHALGVRLVEKGEWTRAVAVLGEQVVVLRDLVEANRPVHALDLAAALTSLGTALAGVDRRAEALGSTVEAVALLRELAPADNSPVRVARAVALGSLAARLGDVERRQEAVDAAEEAVAILRVEARHNPGAHATVLAGALTGLATALSAVGRRVDAAEAAGEAVEGLRGPAAEHPDAFGPGLAAAVGNWSVDLANAGRRAEALRAGQESVALHRRFADRGHGSLPGALADLGTRLTENGRPADAVVATAEAVDLSRALPDARLPSGVRRLEAALTNHGLALVAVGRAAEAVAATEEAVRLCRTLTDDSGSRVATALVNLGLALAEVGRDREALATTSEAVAALRRLSAVSPEAFKAPLARALANRGGMLAVLERHADAVTALRESLLLYRELADADEAGYAFDVADTLVWLGSALSRAGEHTEAVAVGEAAVARHRALVEVEPIAFTLPLARALRESALTAVRARSGVDQACLAAEESVALMRSLASTGAVREDELAEVVDLAGSLRRVLLLPRIHEQDAPEGRQVRAGRAVAVSRWLGLPLLVPAVLYALVGAFADHQGARAVAIATGLVVGSAVLAAVLFALRNAYATVFLRMVAVFTDIKSGILLTAMAALTWVDRIVAEPLLWIGFTGALLVATFSALWARMRIEEVLGRVR